MVDPMHEMMLAMGGHYNSHVLALAWILHPAPGIRGAEPEPEECPECGEACPDDARVEAGMRCARCAYGDCSEEGDSYFPRNEIMPERIRFVMEGP